jgi:hypothetical protein
MKKIILTFVAVAFGSCVAFAQTTPVEEDQTTNTEQSITVDKMSDTPADAEAGRRIIKVEELPEAVQRSLKSGEFKAWKVVAVTELQSTPGTQIQTDNMSNVEGEASSQPEAEQAAMLYEVELVSEDMQEEIQDSQEQTEEIAEDAAEEGVVAEEKMVEVKVPGVVLRYDNQGKLLSRVDRAAENTPANNEQ